MASQGPNFPATAASLANAGTSENAEAWVSPSNIGSDNGVEATITAATYDSPDISQLLVASNFGFSIPAGATILGIVVEIDRRNSAGAASDNRVQLAKGTTFADLVGNNKADLALDWPTTTAVASYGASNDLWGASWSVTDINASSFAVFLSAQADAANTDVQVDYVRVTVTYADTALAGTSVGSSGASAALTTSIALQGSSAGSSSASGVLTGADTALAGSSVGGSSAAGVLTTAIALISAVACSSAASASLTTAIALVGASTGGSTAAGDLTAGGGGDGSHGKRVGYLIRMMGVA
jgi:hypothetical protein